MKKLKSFINKNLEIFNKGKFEEINREYLVEAINALNPIIKIQEKYKKYDNDTFFNELKDGMIAVYLDFELINTEKHGLDAKKSYDENIWLEVKQVSFTSKSWSATFNDTNEEKANAFKDIKTFLAVGVLGRMTELLFIVYGQNPEIGEYLEEKVIECHRERRRSTQTISVPKLIKEYNFKIKAIDVDVTHLKKIFRMKYSGEDWWSENIE